MAPHIDTPIITVSTAKQKTTAPPAAQPVCPPTKPMVGDTVKVKPRVEDPVGSSIAIKDGKITSHTTLLLQADPERVLAELEDSWSKWWPNSKVVPVPADAHLPPPVENERRFGFKPYVFAGIASTSLTVRQLPATAEANPDGTFKMVVPIKLSGDFQGEARFEISATPEGKTLITSRWDGVKPMGAKAKKPEAAALAQQKLEEQALKALDAFIKTQP